MITAPPEEWLVSETARLARNRLSLSVSADLTTWTTVAPILWDDTGLAGTADSRQYTGFQYADFHFDGDDLICAVRTAYRGVPPQAICQYTPNIPLMYSHCHSGGQAIRCCVRL